MNKQIICFSIICLSFICYGYAQSISSRVKSMMLLEDKRVEMLDNKDSIKMEKGNFSLFYERIHHALLSYEMDLFDDYNKNKEMMGIKIVLGNYEQSKMEGPIMDSINRVPLYAIKSIKVIYDPMANSVTDGASISPCVIKVELYEDYE